MGMVLGHGPGHGLRAQPALSGRHCARLRFCLAPAGYGFSSRQYECVLVGCVPIIIQDDVEMAFEEVLPWHRFALRLNFSDIPILPQLLARIPAAHVARLRRGLGCIWPRMLWLTPGLYAGAPLFDDAAGTHAGPPTLDWPCPRFLFLALL